MLERRRRLLVIALLLTATATITTSLLFVPDVVEADRQAFLSLNSMQEPILTDIFWTITVLGSLEFGFIWFGGLWLMRRSDLAAYVLIAVIMEVAIVTFMKETILRPRPYEAMMDVGWLYRQESWSFPSGHAAGVFALCTVIGLKVRRTLPLVATIALAVAFSRVYIGVHYPLDVIAGSLIGILIGLFVVNLDLGRFESYLTRGRDHLSNMLLSIVR